MEEAQNDISTERDNHRHILLGHTRYKADIEEHGKREYHSGAIGGMILGVLVGSLITWLLR